jgi:hypothetical protein
VAGQEQGQPDDAVCAEQPLELVPKKSVLSRKEQPVSRTAAGGLASIIFGNYLIIYNYKKSYNPFE